MNALSHRNRLTRCFVWYAMVPFILFPDAICVHSMSHRHVCGVDVSPQRIKIVVVVEVWDGGWQWGGMGRRRVYPENFCVLGKILPEE